MWTLERSENKLEWESYKTGNTKQFFNIIMERSQRDALERDVDKFLNGKKEYKRRGVPWRRGYLFHGEPGCGKTSLILAITNAAKMDIYCMDLSMFRDDQELRNMFRKIPSKSAIVFEDIDALSDVVKKRKEPPPPPPVSLPISNADLSHMKGTLLANVINGMPKNAITLSALLNELDGIASCHGKILIMTTNALESLDGALVRPGRIDYKMELGRATREEIAMAFELYLNRTVDAEKLPKELDRKYTVAQVCNMIVTGELDEKIER
jgi:chaperone BCS1